MKTNIAKNNALLTLVEDATLDDDACGAYTFATPNADFIDDEFDSYVIKPGEVFLEIERNKKKRMTKVLTTCGIRWIHTHVIKQVS